MWRHHLLKYTSILGCRPIPKKSSVPLSSIRRRPFSMEEERIDSYRSAEIPSISDRLEYLFDNPLQIQELTFKENCKPLHQILDLTCSPNLQVQKDIAHRGNTKSSACKDSFSPITLIDSVYVWLTPRKGQWFLSCLQKIWQDLSTAAETLIQPYWQIGTGHRLSLLTYSIHLSPSATDRDMEY